MRVIPVVMVALSACGGASKSQSRSTGPVAPMAIPVATTPVAPPPQPAESAKVEPAKTTEQVAVAEDPDAGGEVTGDGAALGRENVGTLGGAGAAGPPGNRGGPYGDGTGTISLGSVGTRGGGTGAGYGGAPGRRPSTPQARLGKATIKGKLAPEIIQRITRRHINELRYCYEKHLQAHPDAGGLLVAKYVVSPNGVVASATASGVHADVEACVAGRFRTWDFPKPPDGAPVNVTQPVTFSPS